MKLKPYPKYQDSGIQWIREIPEGWEVNKIKNTSYVKGRIGWHGLSSEEYSYEGAYLVTGTDFEKGLIEWKRCHHIGWDRYKEDPYIHLKENDLLITKDGTIGKVALIENLKDKATLNSGIFLVRPLNKKYLTGFMYWILKSSVFERFFDYIKKGATISHLYQETFEKFFFPIPHKREQIQIVRFLDKKNSELDKMIQKDKQLIELLKEKRTALINHVVTKGLNPKAKMKDSGIEWIGEIPEEWEVKKLKFSLLDKQNSIKTGPFGSQLKIDEMYDHEIKVYNQKNVIKMDESIGENYVSSDKFKELIAFKTVPGDLLITTRGTIGRTLRLSENAEVGILHPCLMKINTDNNKVFDRYIEILIEETNLIKVQLQLLSCATTIEVIYQDNLKEVKLILPPLHEQIAIANYLDKAISKIGKNINKIEEKITLLEEYKKSIINHVVTGKIDVRSVAA